MAKPIKQNVNMLVEMGFTTDQAEHALRIYKDDVNAAATYLLGQPNMETDEPPPLVSDTDKRTTPVSSPSGQEIIEVAEKRHTTDSNTNNEVADSTLNNEVGRSIFNAWDKPLYPSQSTSVPPISTIGPSEPYPRAATNGTKSELPGPITRDDEELNRAIEASLQTAGREGVTTSDFAYECANPYERRRKDQYPVGLKNVGNTCYFNSLIQAYFSIPEVLEQVLKYDPSEEPKPKEEPEKQKENVEMKDVQPSTAVVDEKSQQLHQSVSRRRIEFSARFVTELQRIFALLLMTDRQYIAPTSLLRAVVDENGRQLDVGKQQDVGEFHLLLLERMVNGLFPDLKYDHNDTSSIRPDPISRLFSGTQVQTLRYENGDGVKETTSKTSFGSLFLNVSKGDLYGEIDEVTGPTEVEFTPPDSSSITAQKDVSFQSFPHVLCIQLQRAKYNKGDNSAFKDHSKLSFDKYIDLYRFHVDAEKEYRARRLRVDELNNQVNELNKNLDVFVNYKGQKLPIDGMLKGTLDYVSENCDNATSKSTVMDMLSQCLDQVSLKMRDLRDAIELSKASVAGMFSDMNGLPYRLHAILVHDGAAPGSGHYWTYIHHLSSDTWVKYNDQYVVDVSETEVWKNSLGGEGYASAYCLFYVKCSEIESEKTTEQDRFKPNKQLVDSIPPRVMAAVNADNAAFVKEIQNWDEERRKDKLKIIAEEFRKKFWIAYYAEKEQCKPEGNPPSDPRLRSFTHFMIASGDYRMENCAKFMVANQLYKIEFGKEIEEARETELYKIVESEFRYWKASNETLFLDVNCVNMSGIMHTWYGFYETFMKAAEYLIAGLEILIHTDDCERTLQYLSYSMFVDSHQKHGGNYDGSEAASIITRLSRPYSVTLIKRAGEMRSKIEEYPEPIDLLDVLKESELLVSYIAIGVAHNVAHSVSYYLLIEWKKMLQNTLKHYRSSYDIETTEEIFVELKQVWSILCDTRPNMPYSAAPVLPIEFPEDTERGKSTDLYERYNDVIAVAVKKYEEYIAMHDKMTMPRSRTDFI